MVTQRWPAAPAARERCVWRWAAVAAGQLEPHWVSARSPDGFACSMAALHLALSGHARGDGGPRAADPPCAARPECCETKRVAKMSAKSGIAMGKNKGHVVTPRPTRVRPTNRVGKLGDRTKVIRSVIREVCGFTPYEKRMIEILKGGGRNPQKRAWKFAKKRLGTHVRAKRKVAEIQNVIADAAKAKRGAAKK